MTRTFSPKPADIKREWIVIDATDVVLGRLASHTAAILRGKHKPTFAPHMDMGDFVIIVNAEKIALTGQKLEKKLAYRHSGYPGGLSSETYIFDPWVPTTEYVHGWRRGAFGSSSLGRAQIKKLKVYAGAEHPHAAQQPKTYTLGQVAQ